MDVSLASRRGHCITEPPEARNRIVLYDLVHVRHLETVVHIPSQQRRGEQGLIASITAHEHAPRSRHDVVHLGVSAHERSEIVACQSDAAYNIKNSYEDVLEQFAEALRNWMDASVTVIGFNSGKHDLNAIKQFLIPYFLSTSKTREQEEQEEQYDKEEENEGIWSFFVIKRNNTFMCLSEDQLKFPDNYIAPGSVTTSI